MGHLNYKRELVALRNAGFTFSETRRLLKFYRRFVAGELDRPALSPCRLEFARWLVATHRLSEQLELPAVPVRVGVGVPGGAFQSEE